MRIKKTILRPIMIRLLERTSEEKILKAARKRKETACRTRVRMAAKFSSESEALE
jgi:hypothetical protein